MSRRAAIDIGSNSVKLLVLEVSEDSYSILHDEERVTGLGSGVSDTGRLSETAIADTLAVLGDYARIARERGAESIRAAATSAVRDSSNSVDLTGPALAQHGLEIEIISGESEAHLSRVAALRELPPAPQGQSQQIVFFDVGGGSTELTLYQPDGTAEDRSLQLGARRLADMAHSSQPVDGDMQSRMQEIVRGLYRDEAPRAGQGSSVRLVGLGGTASSVVFMLRGMGGEEKGDPNGAVVSAADLGMLLERIHDLPLEHVKALPNLNPKRAETIYAGIMIIDELLKHYGVSDFTLVDRGLRFGLLLG